MLRRSVLFTVLCALAPFLHAADAPPQARKVDAVDRLHGLTLPDPYRWMEGESNPEFQRWLKAQGDATRAHLDALPPLPGWRERLKQVSAQTVVNRMQRPIGDRVFFLRQQTGGEGVLMVREADGTERALFDPNTAQDGSSITEYTPSPDGKRIAINVDRGGSEITQVSVLDVATGQALPDRIERIWGEFAVSWMPDGSGFAYTQMAPENERVGGDPIQNMRARFHALGTSTDGDPLLAKAGKAGNAPFDPREFPVVQLDADSDWAVLALSGARADTRVCIARRADAIKPNAPWNCVADYDDSVRSHVLHRSTLYLLSAKDAPNGRLLALDLSAANVRLSDARVVLPESQDAVLLATASTLLAGSRDGLYLRRQRSGVDDLVRLSYDDAASPDAAQRLHALPMAFPGSIPLISTDPRSDGVLYVMQSWTQPRVAYRQNPGQDAPVDLKLGASASGDYSDIETLRTEAVSADGTRVPMSILLRKDLPRDRRNLAILSGYGAYGISMQPSFDPLRLQWVKAGHVYAIAHVRGGGEKGDNWRTGGKGELKYKSVEDFIACAKQLDKLGLSDAAHTAAWSASAGGLLVGGAITRAPKAFGAAVIGVGVLNPVRMLEGRNGANQIAELGDPRTPEGLKQIAAMDPYQHVSDRTRYPPLMLVVGLNDQRVVPWHSGKFGARMAAAGEGKSPVWFRTDGGSGHFATSMDEGAVQWSDIYSFIEAQLPGRDAAGQASGPSKP